MNRVHVERKKSTLVGATVALAVYTLFLSMLSPVLSSLQPRRTISNTGTVENIGEVPPRTGWAILHLSDTTPEGPVPFTINGESGYDTGVNSYYTLASGVSYEVEMPDPYTVGQTTYNFSNWDDGSTDNPREIILVDNETLTLHVIYETALIVPSNGLRGNLHTHTTWSDGTETPYDMVMAYKNLGYDFVAITDHDVWTDVSGLQDLGIIVFEGIEHSSGEHWNEIRGGGETLTIKNHPDRYGDTAEEIINGPWDCHEATNHGTVLSYYTTISHPYVYTDDAHGFWEVGAAWIVVDATLSGNIEQDKAIILQAIKAGDYVCQTA